MNVSLVKTAMAGQRRFARVRPEGFMSRMGPNTPKVFAFLAALFALNLGAITQFNMGVAAFEVENPWEHLYAQTPRLGHGQLTGYNT